MFNFTNKWKCRTIYNTTHSNLLSFSFSTLSSFSSLGISCDCWAIFNLSAFDLVSKSCLASADFARSSASLPRMSMLVSTLLFFLSASRMLNWTPLRFFLCCSFRLSFFCSSKYWPCRILADITWRFIAWVNGNLVQWSSSVEILSWTVRRATTVFSWRFSMSISLLTEYPRSTEAWPCEIVRNILKMSQSLANWMWSCM